MNCNSSNMIFQWGDLFNNLKSRASASRNALQVGQLKRKKWSNMPGSHDGVGPTVQISWYIASCSEGWAYCLLQRDGSFQPTLYSTLPIFDFRVVDTCLYITPWVSYQMGWLLQKYTVSKISNQHHLTPQGHNTAISADQQPDLKHVHFKASCLHVYRLHSIINHTSGSGS